MKLLSIRSGVMTVCCFTVFGVVCTGAGEKASPARFTVEPGHAWTPPFGLERVGRPMDAVVEVPEGDNPKGEYEVADYRDGKEIGRQPVKFRGRFGRVALAGWPKEAVLFLKQDGQARWVEIVRTNVVPASFEADAVARPEKPVHPVDYGAILVPDGWLLLAGGQKAEVEVAALSRSGDIPGAVINAWYESAPSQKVKGRLALSENRKARAKTSLRGCSRELKQDALHVAIANGTGKEIWRKDIRVMIVPEPPRVPRFGAVETKLRYDPAIPVNGKQPISFAEGWDPKLQDLVVFFPNGARFVCWRGSSYCPFWASRSNMGLCYEWAEILSGHGIPNVHDCVEPLQDKELRYGRVEIVESTPARVHVRWSYQSCDLDYKVGGSSAVEDYFFYPDGFGTRVLTLTANPGSTVETQEFIIFTPQSGYPLDYLTGTEFDLLWPEGKAVFRFPCRPGSDGQDDQWAKLKGANACFLHRVRFGKDDLLAAIQYSPLGSGYDLPGFPPFCDRGVEATPMYWGCHWPISRGYPTGWAISDRIHEAPGHNSSFHSGSPKPLRTITGEMRDAQGVLKTLQKDTWVWLIGMTEAGDDELRQWAQSYAHPPNLEPQGARVEEEMYCPEHRALRLTVEKPVVTIAMTPNGRCVNPVFELKNAPERLKRVKLGDKTLDSRHYAWDGTTLWLNANLNQPAVLRLEFADRR